MLHKYVCKHQSLQTTVGENSEFPAMTYYSVSNLLKLHKNFHNMPYITKY